MVTSKRKGPMPRKLNFAGGSDIRQGWLNMDLVKLKGVDLVWDGNKTPYPFPSDQFDEILANHALEHMDDLLCVMEEFHRILRPGGKVKVLVPYFASPNSHRDPTHKIWFTSATFSYFSPNSYYSKARFRVVRKRIIMFSNAGFLKSKWYSWPFDAIINATLPVYERFFPYWLPASEVHFELEVMKR